ncbi:hypothetical protein J2I46_08375 [Fibrella sp. HMF5405]|uniref:Curli production assembly/transport component CsgE n=2 Tax=Fibrella forsythiae TaxID=2817061 RepID=A0ABS3JF09_9BACT|nr:hypothetical protein [Fibrella forsythiae]
MMLLSVHVAVAQQDPDVPGLEDLNEVLREEANIEQSSKTTSLLLDNTRSKVGRDFYEIFYRAFNEAAPATPVLQSQPPLANPNDTARVAVEKPLEFELDLFLITIDELPANSGTGSIISVTINDEVVFQQFIQNRLDSIEEFALLTALGVRQYVDTYAETQRQLENEDQRGSGMY